MRASNLRLLGAKSATQTPPLIDALEPRALFSVPVAQTDSLHAIVTAPLIAAATNPSAKGPTTTAPSAVTGGPATSPLRTGRPPVHPPTHPPPLDPPPTDPPPVDPPPVVPPPHLAQVPNVQVIHIGPKEKYQTLNDVQWPTSKSAPVEFLLDPSDTPYVVKQRYVSSNVWIEPADWNHRPTLDIGQTFKRSKKSGNSLIAGNPTLNVSGTLTIRGMNTVGGEDSVLLGSSSTGVIDCEDITMDGGGIWRGSGAKDVYFKDNAVLGIPRANVYSSYTGTVGRCVIDHSGTDIPVPQGGHMSGNTPSGEAAIRIMNVDDLTLIGVKTTPWFYKPGKIWKQDVQLRPASKLITVIDCDFYLVDIGDMAWRKPAKMVDRVDFVDCKLAHLPSLQPGHGVVTLTNCLVKGKPVTKAM